MRPSPQCLRQCINIYRYVDLHFYSHRSNDTVTVADLGERRNEREKGSTDSRLNKSCMSKWTTETSDQ